MALARYTEPYWYPSGVLAAGVAYHVFPRASNVHASLFQDAAGTIALPNPGVTDGVGVIDFYVATGDYWLFINSQSFGLIVDTDPDLTHVWPASYHWDQATGAAVWTITHELNAFPGVTTLDKNKDELFGEVSYVDANTLTITFSAPVAGDAYLRR
jgi:hypothetical protein